jgi:hypothetical protein
MNALLISLGKSLGLAGVMAGILYLLYRQLLAMKIFPKLSRTQAFSLLLLVVILVSGASMVVIYWLISGRSGLEGIARGAYECRAPARPRFPCSLSSTEASGVALDFNGPNAANGSMIDSFHGEMHRNGDIYKVDLINRFNAEPHRPEKQETTPSTLILRAIAPGVFDGTWNYEGEPMQTFHMEIAR